MGLGTILATLATLATPIKFSGIPVILRSIVGLTERRATVATPRTAISASILAGCFV